MKWVLFLLSMVALFAANNALFWVPGRYDWFTAVAAPERLVDGTPGGSLAFGDAGVLARGFVAYH